MKRQFFIVALPSILIISSSLSGQSIEITDTTYHFHSDKVKSVLKFTINNNDTIYEGPASFYYITGDLWQSGSYKNDAMDGLWTTWYTNDTIKRKAAYVNGLKSGEVINYYENGNVKNQLNYINDTLSGLATLYFDNKQVKETRYYIDNKLNIPTSLLSNPLSYQAG